MSSHETSNPNDEWQTVRLSSVFREVDRKERETRIEDERQYKLLTVKLYSKGIVLRDIVQGKKIGVKKLYATKNGDLVLSKIDARNGAWGFVPDVLSGGLVSTDFPILKIVSESEFDMNFVSYCWVSSPLFFC